MAKRVTHSTLVFHEIKKGAPREIYSGLLWIAKERGFKDGWVAHKFREVFGGWPKPKTPIQPEQPTAILVEWLGIEKRRWRARKKREEAKTLQSVQQAPAAKRTGMGANGHNSQDVAEGAESAVEPAVQTSGHTGASDCACWACIVRLQMEIIDGRSRLPAAESHKSEGALSGFGEGKDLL